LVNELEGKDDVIARRMSKEQLIKMMADRNHVEDIAIVEPSVPSPERKKIIQLTRYQLNKMILNILLDNNAVLHGNNTDGHAI